MTSWFLIINIKFVELASSDLTMTKTNADHFLNLVVMELRMKHTKH